MAASSRRMLVRILVPIVLVGAFAVAFWRSVHSSRSAPYTLSRATQRPWRLALETGTRPNDPVLLLEPPSDVSRELFDQVFKRSMESMQAPELVGIPLVLAGELERAGSERLSPDALLAMARSAGLERTPPVPRCMGHRRLPEPDEHSQAYFAMFDSPAFDSFRWNLATRLGPAVDAGSVTPAMFVGLVLSPASRFLPLHADPAKDCVAPIAIASGS
ncbi:MAG TPA: hypothetical protein VHL80_19935 [Polyangia bacterium]|nr:hypothetical protein [Polyangia bacterium]